MMSAFQIENGVIKKYSGKDAEIVIPEGVKSIGNGVFKDRWHLTGITFPKSLTRICKESFSGCFALKRVTFAEDCKLVHIGPSVFKHCTALTHIDIPIEIENKERAEHILKMFQIPAENLLYAFLNEHVSCKDILQTELIRRCCLKNNRKALFMKSFSEKNIKTATHLLSYIKKIPLDELDDYIIKTENFPEFRLLLLEYKNKIYPPAVLEKIDEIEMEKAFGLREKTLADYRKIFKIGRVGDGYQISGYKKTDPFVYIPGKINGLPVRIASLAFLNHTEIISVTIENGLRTIESEAFSGCKGLEKIELPDTLTEIARFAFARCDNLKEIRIPDGVKKIGTHAFARCRQLTDIYVPESVAYMGDRVFFRLSDIIIHAPVGSFAHQYAARYNLKFEPIS